MANQARQRIERMYQRAMDMRDSTRSSIDFDPIEQEYLLQYMRAYRKTLDVPTFKRQTREYRALRRAYEPQGS